MTTVFNKPYSNLTILCWISMLGILSVSCGNSYLGQKQLTNSNIPSSAYASSSTAHPGYSCSNQSTILPTDITMASADDFQVCTNTTASNILLYGSTVNTSTICIFPAQGSSGSILIPFVNSSTGVGQPVYQCVSPISGGGYLASFSGINFNGLFVVEGNYLSRMVACLQLEATTGNYDTCPPYSSGLFR